ncbi:MAG TPA: ABC transporter substrate-binding protein [Roseiflexaceae bacterium]|nr:ABC transporter substrate-binding protein [Roseiflexaceae bacterium]
MTRNTHARRLSRRAFLGGLTGAAGSVLLAACGAAGTTRQPAPGAGAAPQRPLRIAENQFPTSLDGDAGFAGYSLMSYGIAEALMRVTPEMTVVPWLAQRLEPLDPRTWRVTLRDGVVFWDGSPVDAQAVGRSFERSVQQQAGATAALLPPGTTFRADGLTLDIQTPEPVGAMAQNLASFYLTIKRVGADGGISYTGPYQPVDFVEKTSLELRAFPAYHSGPVATPSIAVRYIPDVNTRALALQSGDVDIAHALLPSQIEQLKAGGFQVHAFPFGRQNDIILNVTRPPLDDRDVRRAIALAVDREALLKGVLGGVGTPAYALAPANLGLSGVVDTQRYDRAEAERLLDAAGWARGADGMRAKDGGRLAFGLGFYSSRAELEPLAVAIKDQLRAVGIDVQVEQFPDINTTVAGNGFDATMYSYGVAPNGDIDRAIALLYTPSGSNKERYSNPRVNELFAQLGRTADPARRQRLLGEIQTLVGEDVPVVYVVNPFQIVALSPQVLGFTAHPLENYKIDARLRLGG